ncbi:hypothetical protein Bbelb_293360, partial [Branchiostoma belcheri]
WARCWREVWEQFWGQDRQKCRHSNPLTEGRDFLDTFTATQEHTNLIRTDYLHSEAVIDFGGVLDDQFSSSPAEGSEDRKQELAAEVLRSDRSDCLFLEPDFSTSLKTLLGVQPGDQGWGSAGRNMAGRVSKRSVKFGSLSDVFDCDLSGCALVTLA